MAPDPGEEEVTSVTLFRLCQDDWERHRAIRLEALRTAPDMYSTKLEDMVDQPESFWREIMGKNRYFYVRTGSDVVGLAGLATPTGHAAASADKGTALTEQLPASTGMLISVFVAARARGRRLGALLSQAVIGQARAEGLRAVFLEVAEHNDVARRVYEELGFSYTRRARPTFAPGLSHQELEMRLDLLAAPR
ncbi:GCN5-related N-acetyltransferase [Segniliparus rotundus DSM 44985]|uniref:GCN5-related N-acetyltransferase n=1 Tax=Segniliparus rotundus (strain ATCC BAA-972 / CDC 1076 / CIP 108378 / DSM 44985 / JCM 13578) TaxID=640132 RepID=D6ZBS8_SEGRD|nr:GNAT family N-acetyltransferase [Segniliparus rotundus]ADG96905.1 GCN5-related N-acetyltransferase [Segniliparus rotundus DSM 44985]